MAAVAPVDFLVLLNTSATVRKEGEHALSLAFALYDVAAHKVVFKVSNFLEAAEVSPEQLKARLAELDIAEDEYEGVVRFQKALEKVERKIDDAILTHSRSYAVVVESIAEIENILFPMGAYNNVTISSKLTNTVYDLLEEVGKAAQGNAPATYIDACQALGLDVFGKSTDAMDVVVNLSNIVTKLGSIGHEMNSQHEVVLAPASEHEADEMDTATGGGSAGGDGGSSGDARNGVATSAYVRMRGLPWQTSAEEIRTFFENLQVVDVHFDLNHLGRNTGEAHVVFNTVQAAQEALKYDHRHIGRRYVEVFPSTEEEHFSAVRRAKNIHAPGGRAPPPTPTVGVLKMRGIPFSVREGEIAEFFQGLKIQRDGIHIVRTPDGRLTGEAYVEFTSHEDIVAAQRKNKERIGSRYIELFTSTVDEMENGLRRAASGGQYGGHNGGHSGGFQPFAGPPPPQAYGYGAPPPMHQRYAPPPQPDYYNVRPPIARSAPPPQQAYAQPAAADPYNPNSYHDVFLRVRGLPFAATEQDLMVFFMQAGVSPIGIQLLMNAQGRKSGDGFVQFEKPDDAKRGMVMHRQQLGSRYVEIFHVSPAEVIAAVSAQSAGAPAPAQNYAPQPLSAPQGHVDNRKRPRF